MTSEDLRTLAEALVDVLEERGLVAPPGRPTQRVLKVADVAGLLGRSPAWVYAHAAELGCFPTATAPRRASGSIPPPWSAGSTIDRP
jgi:hypothetical protein